MIRRAVTIGLALIACVWLAVLTAASGPGDDTKRYRITFDNVFGLVESGDVKVGGVAVGEITGFELGPTAPRKVTVDVELNEPGLSNLREDAECAIRQQSLIGEYFVDCELGTGPELPQGGTVPVEQTSSTIPIDLVNNVQRQPYRERFRLIISELGSGLAGRPDDLNEVIKRAHPGLRETHEAIRLLRKQNEEIASFIEQSDTVAAAVEPRRRQLSRWALEASETASVQASRERSIGEQWRQLPTFLAELEPTLAQLDETANRQIPVLQQVRRTAPRLDRFLEVLAPFSDAARTANRELEDTAKAGRAAIDESSEEVAALRRLAPDARSLGTPLRQFLEALDDRERSTEDDPGVEALAPPAPDKTAYRDGLGLTGMEALWTYIYNQTLGTNVYDEVGHLLRIGVLRDTKCSPYSANPDASDIERCSSYLGPYQPGLEAAEGQIGERDLGPVDVDPTEGDYSAAAAERGGGGSVRESRSGGTKLKGDVDRRFLDFLLAP